MNTESKTIRSVDTPDPYRLLFPMGLVQAFFAFLFWAMFSWGWLKFYPREAHGALMYFGFFMSFVVGFLMTAIPKMTSTRLASWGEMTLHLVLGFCQVTLAIRNQTQFMVIVFALQLVALLAFVARRIWISRRLPFEGFYFMPFAFFWAFYGLSLYFFSGMISSLSPLFPFLGEAFLVNLICGLGSRLIPVLSRLPQALTPDIQALKMQKLRFVLMALLLNSSYLALALGFTQLHKVSFLISFSIICIFFFRLFERPTQFSIVGLGLKASCAFVMASKLALLFPAFSEVASQHLLFIGGLFMLTLFVATRVMLAHGKQDLKYELSSPLLFFVMLAFSFAAVLRLVSGMHFSSWSFQLSLALIAAGLCLWGYRFFRILRS